MRADPHSTPAEAASPGALRRAWLLSFTVTVAAIAALLLARSAQAAPPLPAALPVLPQPEAALQGEGLEEEFEAEEEAEEEEYEEDEVRPEGAQVGAEPPEECGLRTARASAVADESESRLRTLIGYTAFEPVKVAIDFRLSGPKGSLTVGRERRRLGYSGAIHGTDRLAKVELARALAAREVTVTVHVLSAPSSCRRYFDRHLRARRVAGDHVNWQQSDSVFGT